MHNEMSKLLLAFIFRTDCAYKENAPKDILGIVGIGQANPKAVHETKSASIYIWN